MRHQRSPSKRSHLLIALAIVAPALLAIFTLGFLVWDEPRLTFETVPETVSTGTATLNARVTIRRVSLHVSRDLAEIVSATPDSIPEIRRGESIDTTLRIALPRDMNAGETISGFVTPFITIWRHWWIPVGSPLRLDITSISSGLPPDPGPDNDQTLDGIDSDGDGVRDDLQRFIAFNFDVPEQVAALRQLARSLQVAILVGGRSDDGALEQTLRQSAAASECYFARFGASNWELIDLQNQAVDTEARVAAYHAFSAMADGYAIAETAAVFEDACE